MCYIKVRHQYRYDIGQRQRVPATVLRQDLGRVRRPQSNVGARQSRHIGAVPRQDGRVHQAIVHVRFEEYLIYVYKIREYYWTISLFG